MLTNELKLRSFDDLMIQFHLRRGKPSSNFRYVTHVIKLRN